MEEEIWKNLIVTKQGTVYDYSGYYIVSNKGNIKRLETTIPTKIKNNNYITKKEHLMKPILSKDGYLYIKLSKKGVTKVFQIHRIVAETFIPNPTFLPEVNHKDENPLNNCINNLEWCDRQHNINWGNRTQKARDKMSYKVNMYDLNNNFIRQFNSLNEASRIMNVHANTICLCCKNKRNKTGGFKWKYADENKA